MASPNALYQGDRVQTAFGPGEVVALGQLSVAVHLDLSETTRPLPYNAIRRETP